MKDTSIFQGWKELQNLRFEKNGNFWKVYAKTENGNGFIYAGSIIAKNETNKALYERALKAING